MASGFSIKWWVATTCIWLILNTLDAAIYHVEHEFPANASSVANTGGASLVLWRVTEGGMFGGRDTDNRSEAHAATITVDLTVKRKEGSLANLSLVFFRPEQELQLGAVDESAGSHRIYCCTTELKAKGDVKGCVTPGDLILQRTQAPGVFAELAPRVPVFAEASRFHFRYFVKRTGIHSVMIADCAENDGPIQVTGDISFRNSYGYLPGQLYGLYETYGVLAWIYFGLAVLWLVWCGSKMSHLLSLHLFVSLLLFMGWIESWLYRHAYASLNLSGRPVCCPLPPLLVFADVVSVIKIVLSKILILLLAMGWGVSRPSLGDEWKLIKIFATIYFCWALAHQLLVSVNQKEQVSMLLQLFIIVPVAVMDSLLIVWLFAELHRTRSTLMHRRQVQKVNLYRRFTLALGVFTLAVIVWAIWAVVISASTQKEDQWAFTHWKTYFLVGGFPPGGAMWDIFYLGLLAAVLVLFRPGQTFSSCAYRLSDERYDVLNPLSGMEDYDIYDGEDRFGNGSSRPRR